MSKIIANKIWKVNVDGKRININLEAFYDLEQYKNEDDKERYKKAKELKEPTYIGNNVGMVLFGEWLFKLNEYEISLSTDKLKLVLLESINKERKKFERLKKKFSEGTEKS